MVRRRRCEGLVGARKKKNGVWDPSKSKCLLGLLLKTSNVGLELRRSQLEMSTSHNVSWISNMQLDIRNCFSYYIASSTNIFAPAFCHQALSIYSFIHSVILLRIYSMTGRIWGLELQWKWKRQCPCSHTDYLSMEEWPRPKKVINT